MMNVSSSAMMAAPIKLGFIAPLTGEASSIGLNNRAAAELAVEEVNAAGGINGRKIEMVYEDGKCAPTDATNAANKLMNVDKVVAIDGAICSSETAAFAPTAMQNKVIVISPGSSAPSRDGRDLRPGQEEEEEEEARDRPLQVDGGDRHGRATGHAGRHHRRLLRRLTSSASYT